MPLLEVDELLPEDQTEEQSAALGLDSTLLQSDDIIAPHASSPAHNPTRSINEGDVSHQNLDSPEGLFGQPVTGPLAVGIPDSNAHGTELSAHSSCGTQVSTPGPQGTDVAVLENLTYPAEHSSDSHPDKSSETPPTQPSTLPQEDVNGTALTEVQDDLMTFDHKEGLVPRCGRLTKKPGSRRVIPHPSTP
ncbi:hypothetical protein MJO29_008014 [Puccinia striiformis f. sp. tritici]|nr:hypothetical protein MJO29_008014 [Puccinia striiformis f. sp. tritici]